MWIELIKSHSDKCEFNVPEINHNIKMTEEQLGVSFHNDLIEVLMESNGVTGEYGLGLLWSTDRIKSENLMFRSNDDFKELYMSFDDLLFFGDAGNGDQFAYPIQNGKIQRNDIFIWNHEEDSRNWIAPNLKAYFEWWLTGKIEI